MHSRLTVQAILMSVFLIGCGRSDVPDSTTIEIDPMQAFGTTASNVFFSR